MNDLFKNFGACILNFLLGREILCNTGLYAVYQSLSIDLSTNLNNLEYGNFKAIFKILYTLYLKSIVEWLLSLVSVNVLGNQEPLLTI